MSDESNAFIVGGFVSTSSGYNIPLSYYYAANNYGFTRITPNGVTLVCNTTSINASAIVIV